MINLSHFLALLAMALLFSCYSDQNTTTQVQSTTNQSITKSIADSKISFTALTADKTGVDFKNIIKESAGRSQLDYDYFYNGAGVAIADFDNDGLADLFFTNNDGPNQIYKNLGDMTFKDMTASALPSDPRWSNGVTTVDFNQDGLMDIYVCNSGPELDSKQAENQLLINKGNFTFEDQSSKYGLNSRYMSVQADFVDFDKDGDLDLWINNHGLIRELDKLLKKHDYYNLENGNIYNNLNRLTYKEIRNGKLQYFRNDNGRFIDVSKTLGVDKFGFGLGLSVADYNGDSYLDVFVSNDYFIPDFMFFNDQKGGFILDVNRMNHTSFYSMGSDANDYNNDGIMDLMAVDMTPSDHYRSKTLMESMDVDQFNGYTEICNFPRAYMFNTLQVGVGNGYFSEIANALEVGLTDWSWSPLFFDMDNDGYQDLHITNGYYRDTKNQDYRTKVNAIAKEQGMAHYNKVAFDLLKEQNSMPIENFFYKNKSGDEMQAQQGLMTRLGATFSNGAAYGDLDNDGDLDLVVNNLLEEATILRNDAQGNFLSVRFAAKNAAKTRHAQLTLHTAEGTQLRDYNSTRGYLSSMEPKVYFGLGNLAKVDSLVIRWQDNTVSTLTNIDANQQLIIDPSTTPGRPYRAQQKRSLYSEATPVLAKLGVAHKEDFHNDFNNEVLLPQKYSSMGPALATGDYNNDGQTDFYLGGSKGHPGKLLTMEGFSFKMVSDNTFTRDQDFEDLGSHFFDANGDGKMDLYVASGGNTDVNNKLLQDRLYINKNNTEFVRDMQALPKMTSSTMTISSFDFDGDKDLDLFVGGRNKPGAYPDKAESYILINNKGKFTKAKMKDFYDALPNMVTDSEVVDLNQDGLPDLVISGEWSYPKFFINEGGKKLKEKVYSELKDLTGWWYSVTPGDFNKDGKTDFVFGNLGLNNKFHSTSAKPLSVYFDDFDDNGSQDIFFAKKYKNKLVPVRGKECSSEQMPVLNERFKTYDAFASAELAEVLGHDKLSQCQPLEVSFFKSIVLIAEEAGYRVVELPFEAQWSPILDCLIEDYNKDGYQDLLIAGNIFNTEPETPSYDASNGIVLLNNKRMGFTPIYDITKTGLNLKNNVKRLAKVSRPGGSALIAANNNNVAQFFIRNGN